MRLRAVQDETPALPRDELQERGNELLGRARVAAIDAVRESMRSEFVEKGKTLQARDVRRWRHFAREAAEAWQKVDVLTSELLREIEKAQGHDRKGNA